MQYEIKRFDVASVVKISFVICAILGIVIGLVYVFIALAIGSLAAYGEVLGENPLLRIAATGFGILLVPVFALFYGCIGAMAGLIFALVYNLIAKALGGVKLTLQGEGTETPVGGSIDQSEMRL
jgi:hypothetical protein